MVVWMGPKGIERRVVDCAAGSNASLDWARPRTGDLAAGLWGLWIDNMEPGGFYQDLSVQARKASVRGRSRE